MNHDGKDIVWTSPSTWSTPVKVGVGAAALGAGIGLAYVLTKVCLLIKERMFIVVDINQRF